MSPLNPRWIFYWQVHGFKTQCFTPLNPLISFFTFQAIYDTQIAFQNEQRLVDRTA